MGQTVGATAVKIWMVPVAEELDIVLVLEPVSLEATVVAHTIHIAAAVEEVWEETVLLEVGTLAATADLEFR
jgi:hypothetical protein